MTSTSSGATTVGEGDGSGEGDATEEDTNGGAGVEEEGAVGIFSMGVVVEALSRDSGGVEIS